MIWFVDAVRLVNAAVAVAAVPACITAVFLRRRPWDERMVLLGLVGYSVLLAWAYLQALGTPVAPDRVWLLLLLAAVTSVSTVGVIIYAVRERRRLRDGNGNRRRHQRGR